MSESGKNPDAATSSEKKDEILTAAIVKANIDNNWYELQFDHSANASSAHDVIQKIYRRKVDGGGQIKYWFQCFRCKAILNHDVSMGSAPLTRHKEKTCPQLTDEQRRQYAVAAAERKNLAAQKKAQKTATQSAGNDDDNAKPEETEAIHVQSTQTNVTGDVDAEPNELKTTDMESTRKNVMGEADAKPEEPKVIHVKPTQINITGDELFLIIEKISKIAALYGPVFVTDLKSANICTQTLDDGFYSTIKEIAAKRLGLKKLEVGLVHFNVDALTAPPLPEQAATQDSPPIPKTRSKRNAKDVNLPVPSTKRQKKTLIQSDNDSLNVSGVKLRSGRIKNSN